MTSKIPVVIGEGAYGCVHKPSLKCLRDKDLNDDFVNYKNKVSKIMPTREALEEMDEYGTMSSIDPDNKYYLGKPDICLANSDEETKRAIRFCGRNIRNLGDDDFQNARLILMKYGGNNLEKFAKSAQLKNNAKQFWIDAHRILLGLKLFSENQVVHHDLKPQNIVYDVKKHFVSFIDFGIMTQKKKIIDISTRGDNYLAIPHWSFPFDSGFYLKPIFEKTKQFSPLQNYKNFIRDVEILSKVLKKAKIQIKGSQDNAELQGHIEKLVKNGINGSNPTSYVLNYLKSPHFPDLEKDYIEDVYLFFLSLKNMTYEEFLSKSIDHFDIFGTGISFMYVLKHCYSLLEPTFAKELYKLFYRLITPDFSKRIGIDALIQEYEYLIDKHLLGKKDQFFINGEVQSVDIPKPVSIPTIPSAVLEHIVQADTQQIIENRVCSEGKTLNVKTGKCVKSKTVKATGKKECPEGKVLNPISGRCVKAKTMKNSISKPCPDGQIRNPKTRRCIKIIKPKISAPVTSCPEGKVLQTITRCVKAKK